jgi:transcriptional regulator with XRE-family HTH domain
MALQLARRMRHFARASSLSQAEIARGIGVSDPSVHSWLSGKNTPTHENLAAFARVCGVDLATFWGPIPPARETARAS